MGPCCLVPLFVFARAQELSRDCNFDNLQFVTKSFNRIVLIRVLTNEKLSKISLISTNLIKRL